MDSKGELKETGIKNRTCHYVDDIMRVRDIDFSDILLDEKSYENILIYDISCKTFMCAKSLRIWFEKIDGFVNPNLGVGVNFTFPVSFPLINKNGKICKPGILQRLVTFH